MKIGATALRIIEMYDAGHTTAQIAAALNTKPVCVRSRKSRIERAIGRRLTELTFRADLNENGLTRKQQLFVDLHRKGLPASEIAALMGIAKSTVYSWRDYIHRVKGVSFEKAKREIQQPKTKAKAQDAFAFKLPFPVFVKPIPIVVKPSRSEVERHVSELLGDSFDRSYYRELNLWRRTMEAA